MPHEATVDHSSNLRESSENHDVSRSRDPSDSVFYSNGTKRPKSSSGLPHDYAETPCKVVHIHDDGGNESDEEESGSPYNCSSNANSSPECREVEELHIV